MLRITMMMLVLATGCLDPDCELNDTCEDPLEDPPEETTEEPDDQSPGEGLLCIYVPC